MTTSLTTAKQSNFVLHVEQARALLASAREIPVVLELRDRAEAMASYLRRREAATGAHADAWEILQHANRRIGELTRNLERASAGRQSAGSPLRNSKGKALAALGLTGVAAARYEKLAAVPEKEFTERVRLGRARITRKASGAVVASISWGPEYDRSNLQVGVECSRAASRVLGPRTLVPRDQYASLELALGSKWTAEAVFVEAPRSRPSAILEKFVAEYDAGSFASGIAAAGRPSVDTAWFQLMAGRCVTCLPARRAQDGALRAHFTEACAVFYVGQQPELFIAEFAGLGVVLSRCA